MAFSSMPSTASMDGRCWSRAILPRPTIATAMFDSAAISERLHNNVFGDRLRQPVDQRIAEWLGGNLEPVASFRLNTFREGQGRRAEEVNMNVARTAEQLIFEMVMFQIGDGVRHVRFARQERLFKNDLIAA